MNWLDRAVEAVSPRLGAARARSRSLIEAHRSVATMRYDAASKTRRGGGLRGLSGDADAAGRERMRLATISRDMLRNNPIAARAAAVIVGNVVGDGIVPSVEGPKQAASRLQKLFTAHLEGPSIDAHGLSDIYGLQRLAMSTVVESGEVIVRRRWRRSSDGLPLPFQLQIMEPDHLDTRFDGKLASGNVVREGIEYDALERRVAYHLFREHPGRLGRWGAFQTLQSTRVEAKDIIHLFRQDRPGQMRGVTWFAPVALQMQDQLDHQDAQLMRQKIAACFAAFIYTEDPDATIEANVGASLSPGAIQTMPAGRKMEFAKPPGVEGYDEFTRSVLRNIAGGLGLTYEALSGDLSDVNFSSARMGRVEMDRNVDAWQWLLMVNRFLQPLSEWLLEAAVMAPGRPVSPAQVGQAKINWTPPGRVIVDPAGEIKAQSEEVRAGFRSRSDVIRSRGYDPEDVERQIAADNERADGLGLLFDSDGRTAKAGSAQPTRAAAKETAAEDDGETKPAD
ncbi:MAG: phage portal protein [Pseudomonadota bacterium]